MIFTVHWCLHNSMVTKLLQDPEDDALPSLVVASLVDFKERPITRGICTRGSANLALPKKIFNRPGVAGAVL